MFFIGANKGTITYGFFTLLYTRFYFNYVTPFIPWPYGDITQGGIVIHLLQSDHREMSLFWVHTMLFAVIFICVRSEHSLRFLSVLFPWTVLSRLVLVPSLKCHTGPLTRGTGCALPSSENKSWLCFWSSSSNTIKCSSYRPMLCFRLQRGSRSELIISKWRLQKK